MFEIEGKYGKAKVYADAVEESALSQIVQLLNQPFAEGADVRIMPDVHAGAGCVIGFTAKLTDKVIPNLIGVDIGCGVLSMEISKDLPPLNEVDDFFKRNIPTGFHRRETSLFEEYCRSMYYDVKELCEITKQDFDAVRHSLGTLGGGNHFAEIDTGENNNWFTVHTGSRNFGLKIATHYQKKAELAHPECPKGLAYLEGGEVEEYLNAMKVAQMYASSNRLAIVDTMAGCFKSRELNHVSSVHNYIDLEHGVIRKGAISAYKDASVVIPLNMRDGVIFGIGKGNEEWNCSAPHGAGRVLSRSKAKSELSLEDFQKSMEGIYSSTINENTLDESPMAYKDSQTIIDTISETVNITEVARPIWNVKGE